MPLPLLRFGGDDVKPTLHLAPANGFPPQTYIPMLRPLMSAYQVVSFPPRAMWTNDAPPSVYEGWNYLADDLLQGIAEQGFENIIAVGHSFGGVGSMLAVIRVPQLFRALILLDPTIMLPPMLDLLRHAWDNDLVDHNPLVQSAKRRRTHFESADAFYERIKDKSIFQDWDAEALRLYAESGTKPADDGVTLTWSSAWEAYYFSTVHHTIWDDLPKAKGLVPTLILRGGTSDTFVPEAYERVQPILPDATFAEIDRHGHLFPQSAPRQTAEVIQDWLLTTLS